ncbi:hypothetical protein [Virgibacillus sp. DJP39]|uniref:hypothetical protein n=1 Tax=Virgibacillus sp. DJP39 TaxID=3409790 RepID=UPI003BB4DE43
MEKIKFFLIPFSISLTIMTYINHSFDVAFLIFSISSLIIFILVMRRKDEEKEKKAIKQCVEIVNSYIKDDFSKDEIKERLKYIELSEEIKEEIMNTGVLVKELNKKGEG